MTESFDTDYWEQRWREVYRDDPDVQSRRAPNPSLLAVAGDLTPGTALDAGCGTGADALWLAGCGWHVTAVDSSATVLSHARATAEALGDTLVRRIDWIESDLATWNPPSEEYDLVTCHYVHTPGPMNELAARLATAVRPGGTLLVVGHHPSDPQTTAASHVLFTSEDVTDALHPPHWRIDVAETRTRRTADSHGHAATAYDTVVRAHRRP